MHNHPNVVLWTDNAGPYLDAIGSAGLADRLRIAHVKRNDQLSEQQVQETNVLMTPMVPPGLLPRMPNLRWAQSMTAGVEAWLALPDLPEGLVLTCARGTHQEAMPENILGALFHIQKPYAAIAEDQKQSLWRTRVAEPLNGATLGILGLGAIGAELARMASALGMTVIGTKRRVTDVPHVERVLPSSQSNEVLARSDFVVLLMPATPETENFIDADRLRHMKPSAWLLNFGRGALIDDEALIKAVETNAIAGAILDVFRQEPLPKEHRFWTTNRILVLPHVGGPHPRRDRSVARLLVDNLRRYVDGQPLLQVVDRQAGY
jgi:phosphoglycerate dehydrogenase-like enzyme